MTDVPQTSPERPIIGRQDVLQLGPVDLQWTSPFRSLEYLFSQQKTVTDVKTRTIASKKHFFH